HGRRAGHHRDRLPRGLPRPPKAGFRCRVSPADQQGDRRAAHHRIGDVRSGLGHRRLLPRRRDSRARLRRRVGDRLYRRHGHRHRAGPRARRPAPQAGQGILSKGRADSAAAGRTDAMNKGDAAMSNYPVDMSVRPEVKAFFDPDTNTISYVVKDPASSSCAVIDSVMDIDYAAGRITYGHADRMIASIEEHGLKLEWIIDTHVHADHLSAAPY